MRKKLTVKQYGNVTDGRTDGRTQTTDNALKVLCVFSAASVHLRLGWCARSVVRFRLHDIHRVLRVLRRRRHTHRQQAVWLLLTVSRRVTVLGVLSASVRRRRTRSLWLSSVKSSIKSKFTIFSAYMLSPVRPSVTRVYHRKTVEVRIMKFSPYGSPTPLVFAGKFHPEILHGSPERGPQTREGW